MDEEDAAALEHLDEDENEQRMLGGVDGDLLSDSGSPRPTDGEMVAYQKENNPRLGAAEENDLLNDPVYDADGMIPEQDRFMPIANVARIMKRMVPESGKISKESKECVQECVSEFISFITSEASERCMQEKRKTINGEDVLHAMETLGFDSYIEPLKVFMSKYREATKVTERTGQDEPRPDNVYNEAAFQPGTSSTSGQDLGTDGINIESGPELSGVSLDNSLTGLQMVDLGSGTTGVVDAFLTDPATGQSYLVVRSENGKRSAYPIQVHQPADESGEGDDTLEDHRHDEGS